ncbi:hypothetical protein GW796_00455 [archaeon]|nr:hypothetical protein [archaeon]
MKALKIHSVLPHLTGYRVFVSIDASLFDIQVVFNLSNRLVLFNNQLVLNANV